MMFDFPDSLPRIRWPELTFGNGAPPSGPRAGIPDEQPPRLEWPTVEVPNWRDLIPERPDILPTIPSWWGIAGFLLVAVAVTAAIRAML